MFSELLHFCFISELSSPPQNIKYEYKTVRTVELEWESPLKPNGQLISFEVLYTYNKSYPDSMWKNESYPLGFFGSRVKQFHQRLSGIKEGTEFYLKIRAENNHGFGPFSKTITIKPPSVAERVGPNVEYTILPSGQVQLSWKCPRVFNAFIESFTILFSNDTHLADDKWKVQTVSIPHSRRFPDKVTTTLYVKKIFIYFKVRAEYNDHIPGKWSKIVKITKGKLNINSKISHHTMQLLSVNDLQKIKVVAVRNTDRNFFCNIANHEALFVLLSMH